MSIDIEEKVTMGSGYDYDHLDLSKLDLVMDVENISDYPNDVYAILRKHGLGTSDSSIICRVNPYKNVAQLIEEKSRDYLTPEERGVGDLTSVKKGRDLEPVIIEKHSKIIGKRILKPSDMYAHKDYPWLKFNFDGVIDKIDMGGGEYQYIPDEIKVVTAYGEKHYDPTKAFYRERIGYMNIPPQDIAGSNNTIETKAAQYGIPAYYYTQLQQQIFGLKAPYGFLTVLFDKTWELVSFQVWRDDATITKIITEGYKIWNRIEAMTGDPNRYDVTKLLEQFKNEKSV